jgi:GH35 family endo-1,4-beta-xylanase
MSLCVFSFIWEFIVLMDAGQNELVADDAPNNTFKNNIWTQKFGENAIPMAFRYAREADPGAKL